MTTTSTTSPITTPTTTHVLAALECFSLGSSSSQLGFTTSFEDIQPIKELCDGYARVLNTGIKSCADNVGRLRCISTSSNSFVFIDETSCNSTVAAVNTYVSSYTKGLSFFLACGGAGQILARTQSECTVVADILNSAITEQQASPLGNCSLAIEKPKDHFKALEIVFDGISCSILVDIAIMGDFTMMILGYLTDPSLGNVTNREIVRIEGYCASNFRRRSTSLGFRVYFTNQSTAAIVAGRSLSNGGVIGTLKSGLTVSSSIFDEVMFSTTVTSTATSTPTTTIHYVQLDDVLPSDLIDVVIGAPPGYLPGERYSSAFEDAVATLICETGRDDLNNNHTIATLFGSQFLCETSLTVTVIASLETTDRTGTNFRFFVQRLQYPTEVSLVRRTKMIHGTIVKQAFARSTQVRLISLFEYPVINAGTNLFTPTTTSTTSNSANKMPLPTEYLGLSSNEIVAISISVPLAVVLVTILVLVYRNRIAIAEKQYVPQWKIARAEQHIRGAGPSDTYQHRFLQSGSEIRRSSDEAGFVLSSTFLNAFPGSSFDTDRAEPELTGWEPSAMLELPELGDHGTGEERWTEGHSDQGVSSKLAEHTSEWGSDQISLHPLDPTFWAMSDDGRASPIHPYLDTEPQRLYSLSYTTNLDKNHNRGMLLKDTDDYLAVFQENYTPEALANAAPNKEIELREF